MSVPDSRSRIKARIWQEIAQENLDVSGLPKATLDELVTIATDAALVELDSVLGESLAADKKKVAAASGADALDPDPHQEDVLWRGRPFLSITTEYIITDERIRIVEGILGKSREDVELVRIQDIDQSQTLRERLLNLGDLAIRSHDRTHPVVMFNNIQDPEKVHELLRRAVLNARKKHGLTFREEM